MIYPTLSDREPWVILIDWQVPNEGQYGTRLFIVHEIAGVVLVSSYTSSVWDLMAHYLAIHPVNIDAEINQIIRLFYG